MAEEANQEVYDFLRTVSARYGIGFWKPGSGIIHQVVLEQYAFPGGMMIGTDSHTPNAGGLGMVAIGVGGADAVDVMTGGTFGLRWPTLIGVRLTGSLSGWTSPKDVILKVAQILTVKGGTGAIVEYFGPGAAAISATGKATICNMGAEIGATTSLFPYDERSAAYLNATGRARRRRRRRAVADHLRPDDEVDDDPDAFFDQVIEIDLVDPRAPRRRAPHARPGPARVGHGRRGQGRGLAAAGCPRRWSDRAPTPPTRTSAGPPAWPARPRRPGLRAKTPLLVTPGSEQVRATIERDGLLADLEAIGATVLANACGPCIGQWARADVADGEPNSIITLVQPQLPQAQRRQRLDAGLHRLARDHGRLRPGRHARLQPADRRASTASAWPSPMATSCRPAGSRPASPASSRPRPRAEGVDVVIDPASDRLQRLEPFPPWDGDDFVGLRVLLKAQGKCTTDHISAAGRWLRYRGHLENISGNLFLGAVNAFTGEPGSGGARSTAPSSRCPRWPGTTATPARAWVAVGDENYGEGSSREHAAMEPRFMGGKAVIVRSFARIAETNLKKQGVLPLVFADPATYDRSATTTGSRCSASPAWPPTPVRCRLHQPDGSSVDVPLQPHAVGGAHRVVPGGQRPEPHPSTVQTGETKTDRRTCDKEAPQMPNPIVHFEIIGKDAAATQKFYADLFDWNVNADNPMNYGVVGPRRATGSAGASPPASRARPTSPSTPTAPTSRPPSTRPSRWAARR